MSRRARGSGSIFFDSRRRRWAAVVSAGYSPATGRRVRLTRHTRTQREAVSALRELAELAERQKPLDARQVGDMLLPDYVAEYVSTFRASVRASTKTNYKMCLARIKSRLPTLRLRDISITALQGFINRAASEGTARSTIDYDLSMIYSALAVAAADGYIDRAPERRRLTLPPHEDKPDNVLTADEYKRIRAHAVEMLGGLMTLILDVGRYMGLRRGEILGMTWACLDRDNGIYRVERQLNINRELAPLKTAASRRVVPVPPPIMRALARRRKAQAEASLSRGEPTPELIICREDGAPYDPTLISTYFRRAANACGITGYTLHGLRHTYASDMAARVDVKTLQGLLGHASASMSLDIYAASDKARVLAAVCPMADS